VGGVSINGDDNFNFYLGLLNEEEILCLLKLGFGDSAIKSNV
jgi:hypothetical protein